MAILEQRDASSTVIKCYFPEGQIEGSSYFYTRDHLGSVREVTDATGAVTNSYEYDAYGRQTAVYQSPNGKSDFASTGHYLHQPSGLYLAPFRGYDANLARWLSRDPIGEEGGLNLTATFRNIRCTHDSSTSYARDPDVIWDLHTHPHDSPSIDHADVPTGKSIPWVINPWEVWIMKQRWVDSVLFPRGPSHYFPGATGDVGQTPVPLGPVPNPTNYQHK